MEKSKICEAMVFAVDNAESASEVSFAVSLSVDTNLLKQIPL